MEVIQKKIKPVVEEIEDWRGPEPGEEQFSGDQVIAAWSAGIRTGEKKGYETGLQKEQDLFRTMFVANMKTASTDTYSVVEYMRGKGFKPGSVLLRHHNFNEFEILITVPLDEFTSPEFAEVYEFTGSLETESESEFYHVTFAFCPESEYFKLHKAHADGYVFTHKFLH